MRAIIFLAFVATVAAQCPPADVLAPCRCSRSFTGYQINCTGLEQRTNLKEIFDNAADYVNDGFVFEFLSIEDTSLLEIGDAAVQHLQFENLYIWGNTNLTHISPRAFNASLSTTRTLDLRFNGFSGERNIFQFAASFTNLWYLHLGNNSISSLIENAFANLTSLNELTLDGNNISSIGSRAFSGASRINRLVLSNNRIPSAGLLEDAWDGISNISMVHLGCNDIQFLEQKSYQPLLDQAGRVFVGGNSCKPYGDWEHERFDCDERMDWVCDGNYREHLFGYLCQNGTGYEDLWAYCGGRNSTT